MMTQKRQINMKQKFRRHLKSTVKQFESSTSLHGLKKIIEELDYIDQSSTNVKIPRR